MVRCSIARRCKEKELVVGLYMPMIRQYVPDLNEKSMKEAVREAGGSINQSGLFLAATSEALSVTSASGINRRSVVYVPRMKISRGVLRRLDRCKYNYIHAYWFLYIDINGYYEHGVQFIVVCSFVYNSM